MLSFPKPYPKLKTIETSTTRPEILMPLRSAAVDAKTQSHSDQHADGDHDRRALAWLLNRRAWSLEFRNSLASNIYLNLRQSLVRRDLGLPFSVFSLCDF